LYVALELSKKSWTVAMTSGLIADPWVRTMTPGAWAALDRLLAQARQRFGVGGQPRIVICYEAGRDGFWIARALEAQGYAVRVLDSASLEVNRRARRNKTDRIDARKLVRLLVRICLGDRTAGQDVRVPTEAQEAARHVSRERTDLVKAQTQLVNQMRGWLATHGTRVPARRRGAWWTTVRDHRGAPLPAELQGRLARVEARLALVQAQIAELETAQQRAVQMAPADSAARRLGQLKGVATTSVSTLLGEGLVWREFRNRREVGALLGFAPTQYTSGDSARDTGISHAGNRRLQATAIQLSWSWLRWQPHSALTRWYLARFGVGKRSRRIGIVALARKLMIALWRYATTGVVPEGALVKGL
jgi:transposase